MGIGQQLGRLTGAVITLAYFLNIYPIMPILTMRSTSDSIYYLVDDDLYGCVRQHGERRIEKKMGRDGSTKLCKWRDWTRMVSGLLRRFALLPR
jgi:hypothetical protein